MRQNEIISNIHKTSYSFQKVRRRSPSDKHSTIMSYLLFLTTTVQRIMHQTCCPLSFLIRLTCVDLTVAASCGIVLLSGALPA
jgi:hypothetical protein